MIYREAKSASTTNDEMQIWRLTMASEIPWQWFHARMYDTILKVFQPALRTRRGIRDIL